MADPPGPEHIPSFEGPPLQTPAPVRSQPPLNPPPELPDDGKRRKRLQSIGAAVALAVGVASVELARHHGQGAGPDLAVSYTNAPGPLVTPGNRAWIPPRPPGSDDPVTFDQLMSRIKEFEGNPAAEQLADAVMKDPALKKIVTQFKDPRKGNGPGTAKEFVHAITGRLEFKELASKFMGSPGSAPLLARVAAIQSAGRAVEELVAAIAALAAVEKQGAARSSSWGTRASAVNAGGGPATGPSGISGLASNLGGQPQGAGAAGNASSAPRMAAVPEAESQAFDPGRAEMPPPPPDQNGKNAQNAVGLNKNLQQASSEDMDHVLKAWLAKYGLDPSIYLGSLGSGLWDQCFTRLELAKCDKACQNQPTLPTTARLQLCTKPVTPLPDNPYWDACLQAGNTDLQCLAKCHQQDPPCELDQATIDKYCKVTPPTACPAECVQANACQAAAPGSTPTPAAPSTPADPTATGPSTKYRIQSGDTLTSIVARFYHITDPGVAYRTALELYDYPPNKQASNFNGHNGGDPHWIYPGNYVYLPANKTTLDKLTIKK